MYVGFVYVWQYWLIPNAHLSLADLTSILLIRLCHSDAKVAWCLEREIDSRQASPRIRTGTCGSLCGPMERAKEKRRVRFSTAPFP